MMMVTRRHTQNKMALAHQCMTYRRVQRTRQQQLNRGVRAEASRGGEAKYGVLCIRDYMVILRRRVVSSNENSGEWKRERGREEGYRIASPGLNIRRGVGNKASIPIFIQHARTQLLTYASTSCRMVLLYLCPVGLYDSTLLLCTHLCTLSLSIYNCVGEHHPPVEKLR